MVKVLTLTLFMVIFFATVIAKSYLNSPVPPHISCFHCTSEGLTECATAPDSGLPQDICNVGERCVTAIIDGITHRGCEGKVHIPFDVDDKVYCTSNICNREIYPLNRRFCYQCEGNKCLTNFTSTLKPCVFYEENDFCVTDVIDETDVIRGCLSDVNFSSGPYASICNTHACNNHSAISRLECISCSSENGDNKSCLGGSGKEGKSCEISHSEVCTVDVLLGRPEEKCFVYEKYGKIVRGCARYGGKLQLESKFFKTCEGNKCNKECINHRKCIVCNSKTDKNCADNVDKLTLEQCPLNSHCFTCQDKQGYINRGCGNPSDIGECYQCQDFDGCNKAPFLNCYNCTSENDPNCAQWTNPEKIAVERCSPYNKCVVAVQKDGATIRGCSSASRPCGRNTKCRTCETDHCNGDFYPSNRQLCHQCKGPRCMNTQEKPIPCKKFSKTDGCFQFALEKEMIRGCLSDLEHLVYCTKRGSKCLECSAPGCNSLPLIRDSNLLCISCNSSNEKCGWTQNAEFLKKCAQKIPYYLPETCFSRLGMNGEVERGCSIGSEACSVKNAKCLTCNSEACNFEKLHTQTCVQCQSDLEGQGSCANSTEGIPPKACNSDIQEFKDRGCFVKREGDVISRGCFVNLSQANKEICKKSNRKCFLCKEQACNGKNAPIPSLSVEFKFNKSFLYYGILFQLLSILK